MIARDGLGQAMNDIPDIEDVGDIVAEAAAAAAIGAACLSCGAAIVGPYCSGCGQRNDDMRRSSFVLFKDFLKDTFDFDSRMWRTLGSMAITPGAAASNYSHGRRSRYTPPVRLFLVVSFLFFLTLGLTHTMFVAVDVRPKTAAEIAADRARLDEARRTAGPEAQARIDAARAEGEAIVIDGASVDCDIATEVRFFVRAQDVRVDEAAWRGCAKSISDAANAEIAADSRASDSMGVADVERGFSRVMAGVDLLIANPVVFNEEINVWLPRVMFFMAPVLALILALFIRGRDALLFDHLVLSLYSHAAAFAIIGAAIVLGQFGVPHVFPVAMALLGVYFIAALRRAYKRGWIKTVLSSLLVGAFYFLILMSVVGTIIANQIWRAAA